MPEPIHSCMTKAVIGDGDRLECGPRWIAARRAKLRLFEDHLECGDWSVAYDQIHQAVLSSFKSPILRIPGYVLAIRTDSITYHFGLNGSPYWEGKLPFSVERQKTRLKLSPISLVARIMVVGGVMYVLWQILG